MLALCVVSLLVGAAPDKPTCVNTNGQTVCGYSCKAESGTAKCAASPHGVCTSYGGQILCFDPPKILTTVMKDVPTPECKVAQGKTACGYHCTSAMSPLVCAKTPAGVCEARYGKTVCFDPPDEVFAVWGANVPAPKCLAQDGNVACGYGCVAASGSLACARTPVGVCLGKHSTARCFDPEPAVLCAFGEDIKRPTCLYDLGQIACGYDCKSSTQKVACALTPRGSCTDGAGGITCFDPPIDPGEATACFRVVPKN